MRRIKGFTLVEMMVTIAVLAIIIGIATPSFVDMMRKNTLRSQANGKRPFYDVLTPCQPS